VCGILSSFAVVRMADAAMIRPPHDQGSSSFSRKEAAAPPIRGAMKGQATEDLAAFFSLRRRLPHQILRRVSGPTTGAGGTAAAVALLSSASGTGS